MREWLARLRDWLRRDQLDRELAEELRFHREHLERDIGNGEARRRFGNVTKVTEDSFERWSVPWMDVLQQDVRYALRGIRRSPGFAATVIVTLALGIGANAAMFGVIDRLMFRPFAFMRDPGTVQRVYLKTTYQGRTSISVAFPYARYLDLRRWTTSFSEYAPFLSARHAIGTGEHAEVRAVVGAGASYFDFFDAPPVLGRFFGPAEDSVPSGSNVVVLGYGFWQSEFGGRNVLGQALQVGNALYTIIGVAPAGFVGVAQTRDPAVFIPITAYATNQNAGSDYYRRYNWDWTELIVRRKPGVSIADASADLSNAFVRSRVAARAVHPEFVQTERANPVAIVSALRTAAGPARGLETRTVIWVSGVAVIVLLIACANVANLYLARALQRRREVALRLALGVSRRRLVSQSLVESLVLALMGCAAGLLVAQWAGAALRRFFLPFLTSLDMVTDWRTLGMSAGAAILAAVATGLAPVLLGERRDPADTLKSGGRHGTSRSGARFALLVAQGALSVILLVGAGLFVRSVGRIRDLHPGFDPRPVLTLYWEQRGTTLSGAERAVVQRRVLDAAGAIPGVAAAAWVSSTPMMGTSTRGLAVPGIDSVPLLGRFNYQDVTAGYFDAVGTRILRGRGFTDADRAGAPRVAIVSEAMAQRIWPGQDALGQCMRVGGWAQRTDTMPCTTVVGIAENALQDPVADEPLRYYLPFEQSWGGSLLVLRLRGDPAAGAEAVRRAILRELPPLSYLFVETMQERFDRQRKSWLMGATMFVAFGVLALIVAAVGLYGVISYGVAQRTQELGIRVALGARTGHILGLVVGQGVRFALAGIVAGVLLSLIASRWIQPLLFQQSAKDPLVYGLVAAVLLLVTLVACAVPAKRAAGADPNTALRAE